MIQTDSEPVEIRAGIFVSVDYCISGGGGQI